MGRQPKLPTREPILRPRYSRIAAAAASAVVTLVAVLGAANTLPVGEGTEAAFAGTTRNQSAPAAELGASEIGVRGSVSARLPSSPGLRPVEERPDLPGARKQPQIPVEPAVPVRSGRGKRVVFDISDQRVWLVSHENQVQRSYLVSGSLTDNLGPGTYEVYSTSRHAIGIDDSGTMEYMIRFTSGENAAIGFHDIPVKEGEKVQTRAELGTPQSHGCIRQWRPDARAMWAFAPVGTTVVVLD
ncbi:MAG: L,D-transpeptidase [Actinomycetota bacterium]|nr:L,D-transpeptidase [Actinomycetota bacterium]